MIVDPELRARLFSRLTRPSGALALLAIDQRESLRTLLARMGLASADADMTAFKVLVTRVLSPYASGLLIDPLYGLDAVLQAKVLAPTCGLIVAADYLVQAPGEPPSETEIDASIDLVEAVGGGAVALKFLVLWQRDRFRAERLHKARVFVEQCAALGVLSVVEGVVRGPDDGSWDRELDVLDAAREFGQLRPDLYKAEVPTLGHGSAERIEAVARQITDELPCPWVALSAGVDAESFPRSVEAVCRGGASGFLAGRGIWGPSIQVGDLGHALMTDARPRLQALAETVDRVARPVSMA